ncbi:thermostable hemolysin [Rhodoferax sp.]|uniref:thermostable hemolysin n=1 Tax=Rhodoferax sp. TaxID=50421 RepID=UPI00262E6C4F|nr:thermostable hemolysin [Rhodoferax sp.]MDD2923874.1 thermostable hemolysin [Rhodoferax sp.]
MSIRTNAQRKVLQTPMSALSALHAPLGSPHRLVAEKFIHDIFASRYGANIPSFAPNLMVLERNQTIIAATGWRSAQTSKLYLEHYLDLPIEQAMAQLAHQHVKRERIVEVGHLASQKAGGSVHIIRALADHLSAQGFEWVVFTATQELIGIFAKLGLPLLALTAANPARLRDEARHWGSYYDTQPIVVAGKIRLALQRMDATA